MEEEEENERGGESSCGDYTSEDEGTEDYRRGGYHAVRIGDSFKKGTYVVQSKLGWGHFSTVWLAWDTAHSRYVALKVQKSAQHYTEAAMDEITILKQIAEGDADDGKCVVKLLDHFKHSGPNGNHVCMVFEYLGDNLLTLIKYSDYRGVPLPMVKELCHYILVGLDYLHRRLSIIHTDLKPENVLLLSSLDPSKDARRSGVAPILLAPKPSAPDSKKSATSSVPGTGGTNGDLTKNQKKKMKKKAKRAAAAAAAAEAAEIQSDAAQVHEEDGIVEEDGATSGGHDKGAGKECRRASKEARKKLLMEADLRCKLVDFGNACWTYKQFTSDIQTRQYRCPEVLLGSKYSTSADMWSFACICFELATGDVLFDPHSGDNFDRDELHGEITSLVTFVVFFQVTQRKKEAPHDLQTFAPPDFLTILEAMRVIKPHEGHMTIAASCHTEGSPDGFRTWRKKTNNLQEWVKSITRRWLLCDDANPRATRPSQPTH